MPISALVLSCVRYSFVSYAPHAECSRALALPLASRRPLASLPSFLSILLFAPFCFICSFDLLQCNHEFAKRFGLGDGDLPTLVAFSSKHGVYSKFVGSWSSAKVSAFIGSAVAGRKPTSSLVGDGPVELPARDCVAQYKQTSAEIAAADAGSAADSAADDEWLAEIRAEEAAAAKALDDELEAQAASEKKAAELAAAKEKMDAKNAERQALIDAERARRKAKRKAKKKKKKKKKKNGKK